MKTITRRLQHTQQTNSRASNDSYQPHIHSLHWINIPALPSCMVQLDKPWQPERPRRNTLRFLHPTFPVADASADFFSWRPHTSFRTGELGGSTRASTWSTDKAMSTHPVISLQRWAIRPPSILTQQQHTPFQPNCRPSQLASWRLRIQQTRLTACRCTVFFTQQTCDNCSFPVQRHSAECVQTRPSPHMPHSTASSNCAIL